VMPILKSAPTVKVWASSQAISVMHIPLLASVLAHVLRTVSCRFTIPSVVRELLQRWEFLTPVPTATIVTGGTLHKVHALRNLEVVSSVHTSSTAWWTRVQPVGLDGSAFAHPKPQLQAQQVQH